jgi:branched-chain amino acid transport system substrate-binding protein
MHIGRLLALIGMGFVAAACSRSRGPIQIGLAGPFGDARGTSMRHGAELALAELNARGGVRGRQLELAVADDSGSEDTAVRVAQQLYANRDVVAVIGHLASGTSLSAAQVYGADPTPLVMVTPSATSPDLSGVSPYVFRLCPTDIRYGTALARFARQSLGAERAGILFASNAYGRGFRNTFRSEFVALGGKVVEEDPYIPAIFSIEPYLTHLNRAGIDVLVLAVEAGGSEMTLRQIRALGAHWRVLGGDALAGIESAGDVAEGVQLPAAYLPDAPGARNSAFVAAYAKAYPGERPDSRSAGAYDAVNLIARAIEARGADREEIRDYLAGMGRRVPALDGVTGRISFDSSGDVPVKDVVIGMVHNGRLVMEHGK